NFVQRRAGHASLPGQLGHVAGTGDITQHCSHESGVVTGLFLRCLNVEADVFFVAQVFCRVPSPGFDLDTHASAVTQAVKPFIEVFGGLDRHHMYTLMDTPQSCNLLQEAADHSENHLYGVMNSPTASTACANLPPPHGNHRRDRSGPLSRAACPPAARTRRAAHAEPCCAPRHVPADS